MLAPLHQILTASPVSVTTKLRSSDRIWGLSNCFQLHPSSIRQDDQRTLRLARQRNMRQFKERHTEGFKSVVCQTPAGDDAISSLRAALEHPRRAILGRRAFRGRHRPEVSRLQLSEKTLRILRGC